MPSSVPGLEAHGHRAHRNGGRKKILIVDDNLVFLRATASKLKSFGYDVLVAEDGSAAISNVRHEMPDLILLDLNFPPDVPHGGGVPWDGLMILGWLRRMNDAQNIPVIAVTASDLEEYRDQCLAAGVVEIFRKPVDHAALLAVIRWVLNEPAFSKEPEPAHLEREHRGDTPPERDAQPKPQPKPETQAAPSNGLRILFVDDETDWRYMGALYLKECGYEVFTIGNAVGALVQAAAIQPHLVVLDLNLAGQSSVPLLKHLAAAHPNLPILIYTGRDLDEAEVAELVREGAADCLLKDTMDDLLMAVGKALGTTTEKTQTAAPPTIKNGSVLESLPADVTGPLLPPIVPLEAVPSGPEPEAQAALQDLQNGPVEELPASLGDAAATVPEQAEPAPEPPAPLPAPVTDSAAEPILIISEDNEFGATVQSFLQQQSFCVSGVSDGAQAVPLLSASEVDLIIFDMAVPSLKAEQFYHAVKNVKPHLCKRIIFITNDDVDPKSDGFVRRAKAPMLWRPFPLEDLLEVIQTTRKANLSKSQST